MNFINSIKRFVRDEDGISTVEYGLVLALVGVVVAAGLGTLGGNINSSIEALAQTVSGLF
ncbi:Flp family type IVb pilin [Azohydromonas lata]|uniref:Flp family type IVb pilin n=1 Tax=Azohydromonas lata TaxID=45677 RepID=A0ABU5IIT6_9BURK|nr:Flp family type IVb pilin [Azohydromonas lata]MDZ5458859.1 Flp family type IVb pilin [Azohydromonas lata]